MQTKWWLQAEAGAEGDAGGGDGTAGGQGEGGGDGAAATGLDAGAAAAKAGKGSEAKDAAGGSAAGDTGGEPGGGVGAGGEPPALSPDTWREFLADGDDKALARLQRFQSPRDIWKQNREFERKLSSGEMRMMPKKDASEDEMKRFRQEIGVPEKPEDYRFEADGKEIDFAPEERELYGPTLKAAHELGLTQEGVNRLIQAEAETNQILAQRRVEADQRMAAEIGKKLNEEWGSDFELNQNLIRTSLDRIGEGMYDLFTHGRLADGTPIASHVGILNWIAGMERELNPMAEILPGSSAVTVNSIDEEIAELDNMMKTDRKKYNSGKFSPDMTYADRYRQLLEAKEKLEKRGR